MLPYRSFRQVGHFIYHVHGKPGMFPGNRPPERWPPRGLGYPPCIRRNSAMQRSEALDQRAGKFTSPHMKTLSQGTKTFSKTHQRFSAYQAKLRIAGVVPPSSNSSPRWSAARIMVTPGAFTGTAQAQHSLIFRPQRLRGMISISWDVDRSVWWALAPRITKPLCCSTT